MNMNRRHFLTASATVAGVAAISPYIRPANASVPATGDFKNVGFYRTKVGAIEVTSLLDGEMALGDSLMLNTNAKDLADAKQNNFIKQGTEFPAYVNAFVVNTGKKLTLIDTGAKGMAQTLGHVSINLSAAGYSVDMIDEVIITHAHPDHTNGLVDENGGMMFPNAKIKISSNEFAFWFDDVKMNAAGEKKQMFEIARKNLGPYKAKDHIEIFQPNKDFGGGLTPVDLSGHTPGHTGVRISDGDDQLLIWGDIVHVPALQFKHPEASINFDVDAEAARATRFKIFDEVAKDKIRVAGMHLSFPGSGYLAKEKSGYTFVPQAWETSF